MPQRPEEGRARPSKRELAEIFGDVLPDTTKDERSEEPGDTDSWHLRNRPPHHDRER
ncbi:MAG: hypothetical protein ACRDRN_11740 [Sciscionella sp.]